MIYNAHGGINSCMKTVITLLRTLLYIFVIKFFGGILGMA
jgi:hypothetical protein